MKYCLFRTLNKAMQGLSWALPNSDFWFGWAVVHSNILSQVFRVGFWCYKKQIRSTHSVDCRLRRQPQKEDDLKIKDDLQNEDDLKNEDKFKMKMTTKMKTTLKIKMTSKRRLYYFCMNPVSLGDALTTAAVQPFFSMKGAGWNRPLARLLYTWTLT